MAETVGFNVEIGLDASELSKGLKDVNDELKTDKIELKEIEKQLKLNPDNVEKWKKKQELLNNQIENTKKKIALQQAQLKKANEEFDGTEEAKIKVTKLSNELKKANNELRKLEAQAVTTREQLQKMTSMNIDDVKNIGNSLTNHITKPALAAVTALTALATATANNLDELADTASKVNADVKAYQELMYVTKILGGNQDALYRSFIKINAILGDIASGESEEAAEMFKEIGLSIDDIKGKDTTESFMIIRKALAQLGDESLRVSYANKIFGDRIGAEILPLLNAEDATIQSLTEEVNRLGMATEEQINISGNFTDEVDRLKQSMYGVSLELMESVSPALINLMTVIREKVVPSLKELINSWNELDTSRKVVIGTLTGVTVAIGPLTQAVIGIIGIVSKFKELLAGVLAGTSKISLSFLGWAGIIMAVVAALTYAYTSNENFRNSVNDLFASLKPVLDILLDLCSTIVSVLSPALDVVAETLSTLIPVITTIVKVITTLVLPVLEFLKSIIDGIVNTLKTIFDYVKKIVSLDFKGLFGKNNDNLAVIRSTVEGNARTLSGNTTNNSNINNTSNTNNNVNVYTTSSTFDLESINIALGGLY